MLSLPRNADVLLDIRAILNALKCTPNITIACGDILRRVDRIFRQTRIAPDERL
jgi:hypothetical protein